MSIQFPEPARISRLQLPERKAEIGMSLREGERVLEVNASKHQNLVDLTYADTKRFPAPDYAINPFPEPATAGALSHTAHRGGQSVRSPVAPNVSAFMGIDVDPDRNLILTPGTQAALYAALSSVVEDGDKVAMMDPDYLTNGRMLRYLSAQPIRVPLRWEESQEDTIDFDALEAAFKGGARVFCSPTRTTRPAPSTRRRS